MDAIKPAVSRMHGLWRGGVVLTAAIVLLGWLLNTPEGLLGKADAIGYAVCHRIELRSLFLGERQLPLCARCSGMYLGAVFGLIFQWVSSPRKAGTPPRSVLAVLAVFIGAFILDGINSLLSLVPAAPTLYTPMNSMRLFTGTGMGLALALVVYPAFNTTLWANSVDRPAIPSLRHLTVLALLAVGLDVLLLLENPLLLYPLALVSAGGVILLLTMVYTMLWLMILKAEKRYNQVSEILYPLLGGFTFAMIQIGLLDALRFILTGTWEGFHLG